MEARLRSWWQRIKPLENIIISISLVGLLVLIILIVLGYIFSWDWTGLGAVNSEPKQHMKTLWDWLQLLIIPAALAAGGYLFNFTVSRNEREIASDNQRETALKEYIDKMSELLLDKQLRESKPEDEIRTIARVRTLTVLHRLDAARKSSVFQFLQESNLVGNNQHIVDLHGADLSGAFLAGAKLSGANLMSADLSETRLLMANLSGAVLNGANLSEANLFGAKLNRAELNGANLSKANLTRANLSEASLLGANLHGANLTRANLSRTVLSEADLSEADLSYAHLVNAIVTNGQLDKAKSLKGTTLPDGSPHP